MTFTMRKNNTRCVAVAAALSFAVWGQSTGPNREVQAIRGLISRYATSVDKADTALAAQIWSGSTDVSFIHPLGHAHGFDQVKDFLIHIMGDTFSERKLSVKDLSIHVYEDSAWAEFYWDFVAKLRKDGSAVITKGRETQIYHREQGEWRLVHVHYSGMPVIGEAVATSIQVHAIANAPSTRAWSAPGVMQ